MKSKKSNTYGVYYSVLFSHAEAALLEGMAKALGTQPGRMIAQIVKNQVLAKYVKQFDEVKRKALENMAFDARESLEPMSELKANDYRHAVDNLAGDLLNANE